MKKTEIIEKKKEPFQNKKKMKKDLIKSFHHFSKNQFILQFHNRKFGKKIPSFTVLKLKIR